MAGMDPDSPEWSKMRRIVQERLHFDPALLDEIFREGEREARVRAKHLKAFWVIPARGRDEDGFGVAAYSPSHAERLVRTYAYPFVRPPEPFDVRPASADQVGERRFFDPDIWHPDLPREETELGRGELIMPFAHPKDDDIERVLDALVATGFSFVDVPNVRRGSGDAFFDDPGFDGREPKGATKLAFVLTTPAYDIDEDLAWFASKMEGPLEEEHDDKRGIVEPRMLALDGPLPERFGESLTSLRYNVW